MIRGDTCNFLTRRPFVQALVTWGLDGEMCTWQILISIDKN